MGILKELFAIADKEGIEVIQLSEAYHPRDLVLLENDSASDINEKHVLLQRIFEPYRSVKSSTLRSLSRGQRSEIDFINGYIAQKGLELGIPTPINSQITRMVKEIEAKIRTITPENLSDISSHD